MQECQYCGARNEDGAAQCSGCSSDLRPQERRQFLPAPGFPRIPTWLFLTVLAILWAAAITLFALYGYYGGTNEPWLSREFVQNEQNKGCLIWGSFGLAVATSTAAGALLIRLVRMRRLGFVVGLLLLTVSTVLCPFIMEAAVEAVTPFTLIEWSGGDGWSNFALWIFSALWACLAWLVFSVILAVASRRPRT
jgi:hypothetical protein